MKLSDNELMLHDLVGKTLALPDGAKLLQAAVDEANRRSAIERPEIEESMRRRMYAAADRMIADLERVIENKLIQASVESTGRPDPMWRT